MDTKPRPETFNLAIGAKRQVTLPARLLQQLSLREGDYVQLTLQGHEVTLVPMISVPRHLVSRELLQEMNARRGARPDDIPLAEFAAEVGRSVERNAMENLKVAVARKPRQKAAAEEETAAYSAPQKYMTAG